MDLQGFYQVRGILYKFTKRYETILRAALKFLGFFIVFRLISTSSMFAGTGILNAVWLQLVLAAVSTVLPNRCGVLLALFVGGYNIVTASLIGGVLLTLFMLILYIITVRFTPEYTYFMLLIPVCIQAKLYLMVPLLSGLYIGTMSIIPIITGTMVWGVIQMIPTFLAIQSGELELDQLPQIITSASSYGYEQLAKNNEMIVLTAILIVVMLIVYLLMKLQKDYIQYMAIVIGGAVGLIGLLICKMTVGLSAGYFALIFFGLLSIAITALIQIMWIPLDYKAAQNLNFSDDDYFYQVRVIPKINVGKEKREVKKITDDKREKHREHPAESDATRVNWKQTQQEEENADDGWKKEETSFFLRDDD